MPLTITYTAKAPIKDNMGVLSKRANQPAQPQTNWTDSYMATMSGELVPEATAEHTLYLVGGPMARLLVDGKEVLYNYNLNTKAEFVADYKIMMFVNSDTLTVTERSVKIKLEKGKPVHIEIQFATPGLSHLSGNGKGSYNYVSLEWSREGFNRHVVPGRVLRHQPSDMCLTYAPEYSMVYTKECAAGAIEQKWRTDGGFIRPAGFGRGLGDVAPLCLRSDNRPYGDFASAANNKLWCSLQYGNCAYQVVPCDKGGYSSTFVYRTLQDYQSQQDAGPDSCEGMLQRPAMQWRVASYSSKTLIRSLNSRLPQMSTSVGTATCIQEFNSCFKPGWWSSAGHQKRAAALACDIQSSRPNTMCLKGRGDGSSGEQDSATLATCAAKGSEDHAQLWLMSELSQATRGGKPVADTVTEAVWGGSYLRLKHHALTTDKQYRLNGDNKMWPFRADCDGKECKQCSRGYDGNTCDSACDGICDEADPDNGQGSTNGGACARGTDQYDCVPQQAVRSCARLCNDNAKCAGFTTAFYEAYSFKLVCYLVDVKYGLEPEALVQDAWPRTAATVYAKLNTRASIPHAKATIQPQPQPCNGFKNAFSCAKHCKWEFVRNTAAEEDPACQDTNKPDGLSFTCKELKLLTVKEAEVTYDGLSKGVQANTDISVCTTPSVGAICAKTCEASQYCESAPSVCRSNPDAAQPERPESARPLPRCKTPQTGSRKMCDTCFLDRHCVKGAHCCPFMRRCVTSLATVCYGTDPACSPACYESKDTCGTSGCGKCKGCSSVGSTGKKYTWLEWAGLTSASGWKTPNTLTCLSEPAEEVPTTVAVKQTTTTAATTPKPYTAGACNKGSGDLVNNRCRCPRALVCARRNGEAHPECRVSSVGKKSGRDHWYPPSCTDCRCAEPTTTTTTTTTTTRTSSTTTKTLTTTTATTTLLTAKSTRTATTRTKTKKRPTLPNKKKTTRGPATNGSLGVEASAGTPGGGEGEGGLDGQAETDDANLQSKPTASGVLEPTERARQVDPANTVPTTPKASGEDDPTNAPDSQGETGLFVGLGVACFLLFLILAAAFNAMRGQKRITATANLNESHISAQVPTETDNPTYDHEVQPKTLQRHGNSSASLDISNPHVQVDRSPPSLSLASGLGCSVRRSSVAGLVLRLILDRPASRGCL